MSDPAKPKSMSALMATATSPPSMGRATSSPVNPNSNRSSRSPVPPSRRKGPASMSNVMAGGSSSGKEGGGSERSRRTSGRRPPRKSSETSSSSSSSLHSRSDHSRRSVSILEEQEEDPRSSAPRLPSRSKSSSERGGNVSGEGGAGDASLSRARDRLNARGGKAGPSPRVSRRTVSDASGLAEGLLLQQMGSLESGDKPQSSSSSSSQRRSRERPSSSSSNMNNRSRSADAIEPILESQNEDGESQSQRRDRASLRGRGRSREYDEDATGTSNATTSQSQSERGRRSSRGNNSSHSKKGRSRSRSKSAKRRTGGRKVQAPSIPKEEPIIVIVVDNNAKEKEKEVSASTSTSNTVTSTSVKVRRKPAHSNTSLAALAMLDDLNPRLRNKGSRDARSVGTDVMLNKTAPQRSKSGIAPQRKVMRTRSQDASGIGGLAAFLVTSEKGAKRSKGSSRSVSSMPMPKKQSSGEPKKQLRRRLKKGGANTGSSKSQSDDEWEEPVSSSKLERRASHGHRSVGSGLDLHSASSSRDAFLDDYKNTSGGSKKGKKPPQRGHSSFGSGLDLHTASSDEHQGLDGASLDVSDLLESLIANNSDSEDVGRNQKRAMSRSIGRIPDFKPSDLGSLLAQQKESRKSGAGGASLADETIEGIESSNLEDIFSYYSWSTSRQPRHKVQTERKRLSDVLRQGPLLAAYESFVRTVE